MKINHVFFMIFIAVTAILCPPACSTDYDIDTTIVSINTGLGKSAESAGRASAPSGIESITLTITGAYMDKISEIIPPETGTITIQIPSGKDRTFEVLAAVTPENPSPVKSYRGRTTVNLKAGSTVSVPIFMNIFETKIVIPDMLNSRIVQIDNMEASTVEINDTWQSLGLSNLTGWTSFTPYDVDFDSSGRILVIATYNDGTGEINRVLRFNDITDTAPYELFQSLPSPGSIAVDRKNKFVYYTASSSVYRSNMDGSSSESYMTIDTGGILGIAIDVERDLICFSCESDFRVYSLSTKDQLGILNKDSFPGSPQPCDIIIINSEIYGSLFSSGLNMIVRFSFDRDKNNLSPVNTYSTSLVGPRIFLAPTNPGLCFIDEVAGASPQDRIIHIDDIWDTNPKVYGQSGAGEPGYFNFFL